MSRFALLPLVLLVAVVAGCGTGGGPRAYALAPTRKCLDKQHIRFRKLTPRNDYIASIATGGALAVLLPFNRATLVFGGDDGESTKLAAGYQRTRSPSAIETQRNVVIVWTVSPSDQESQSVAGCLR